MCTLYNVLSHVNNIEPDKQDDDNMYKVLNCLKKYLLFTIWNYT